MVSENLACSQLRSPKIFLLFLIWRPRWDLAIAEVINRLIFWRQGYDTKSVHITFVENSVVLEQFNLRVLRFSPVSITPKGFTLIRLSATPYNFINFHGR